MSPELIEKLVLWCGFGHIGLCIGSLLIPKVLNWKAGLASLRPLFRQMFWTYAAYILFINLFFGIASIFAAKELLNGSFLAKGLTLFISLYWLARIFIQLFYFDKSGALKEWPYKLGEFALMTLFTVFTVTYLIAFLYNNEWL